MVVFHYDDSMRYDTFMNSTGENDDTNVVFNTAIATVVLNNAISMQCIC